MAFDPMQFFTMVVGVPALVGALVLVLHFRLKMKQLEMRGPDSELGPEVDALRVDLKDTQAQLAEMQERLDFTDRLLAGGRASQEDTNA